MACCVVAVDVELTIGVHNHCNDDVATPRVIVDEQRLNFRVEVAATILVAVVRTYVSLLVRAIEEVWVVSEVLLNGSLNLLNLAIEAHEPHLRGIC